MEKKTNKAKLEIFKFLTKIYKNMLIQVLLHAKFISVMKTVQNPTIFMKNAKKLKNK